MGAIRQAGRQAQATRTLIAWDEQMVLMVATSRTLDTSYVNQTLEAQIFYICESTSSAFRRAIVWTTIPYYGDVQKQFFLGGRLRSWGSGVGDVSVLTALHWLSQWAANQCWVHWPDVRLPLPQHPAMAFIPVKLLPHAALLELDLQLPPAVGAELLLPCLGPDHSSLCNSTELSSHLAIHSLLSE